MKIEHVILDPILTEKGTKLAAAGVYMFNVSKKANKNQVKDALEKLYSVEVAHVEISNRKGKIVRRGRRMAPKILPGKKIAYVKVKKGKIDIFPQA